MIRDVITSGKRALVREEKVEVVCRHALTVRSRL
jgi:hypothetical protein